MVRFGKFLVAGVWFALGLTALAGLLILDGIVNGARIAVILFAVLPPVAIGAGSLLIRGRAAMQVLMIFGVLIGVLYLVWAVLGLEGPSSAPQIEVWGYLVLAAPGCLLLLGAAMGIRWY